MKRTSLAVLIIAYIAFISLGLPDGLLGVAWPTMSTTFGRPLGELGVLFLALMIGFLTASVNSGRMVARFGVGWLLFASSILVTISLVGYVLAPAWWVVILLTILLGAGGGTIDAGMNTYAAAHFSPRHVNWLHAFYGLGATLGPLMMTAVLSSGQSWRLGYGLVGVVLGGMAICFGVTRRLWHNGAQAPDSAQPDPTEQPVRMTAVLKRPLVWLGMAMFLVYTGLEVTAGQWSYSLFTEGRGIDPDVAGTWVSIYWGSLTVGRVVFGLVVERFSAVAILRVSTTVVVGAALVIWLDITPLLSFVSLAVIGFMLAPIFPLLIAQTPARLGSAYATHAIGFQVAAANVGVAMVPGSAGLLVRALGIEIIGPFLLVVACGLWLLYGAMSAVEVVRPVTATPHPTVE